MTFQKKSLDLLKTTAIKRPNSPNLKIDNPLDKDIFVNSIDLNADINFAEKGNIIILINGVPKFTVTNISTDNPFENFGIVSVPLLNQALRSGESIEVFIWNAVDTDEVKITAEIIISENIENLSRGSTFLEKRFFVVDINQNNISAVQPPSIEIGATAFLFTIPTGKKGTITKFITSITSTGAGNNIFVTISSIRIRTVNFATPDTDLVVEPVVGMSMKAGDSVTLSADTGSGFNASGIAILAIELRSAQ